MLRKKLNILFWTSVAGMFLMSASFLIMPYAGSAALDGNILPVRLSGIWFWSALFIGYISFITLDLSRKKLTAKCGKSASRVKAGPGIIRVFSNKWAVAADIAFAVSLTGFFLIAYTNQRSYIIYVFLAAAVFTLHMHGVLNGENFKYINEIKKDNREGVK